MGGELPHFLDLSVGELLPINMPWRRRCSFFFLSPSRLHPLVAFALSLPYAHVHPLER